MATFPSEDGLIVRTNPGAHTGWTGLVYEAALNETTCQSVGLSLNVARIPLGVRVAPHIHVDFEAMIYILAGRVRMEYGPGLRHAREAGPGDLVYIRPGVPHAVENAGEGEAVAIVARNSATELESVVPYDPATDQEASA